LKLAIIPVTAFQQNCSLVICPATNRAAFVDPGGEADRLFELLDKRGATLEKVLVTHGHIDHCGAVAEVAERAGVPIEGPHPDESFWIDQLDQQGRMFGLPGARCFTPDRWLHGGDVLFKGSIGRTDFPRGDHATLIRSITTQLWPLGDEMKFVPGHGPMSSFGAERRSNPFVGDAALRGA
jgi:glyoxylase-like metal-dependent hydrolase (beta-lactamase superfamily II)